MNIKEIGTKLIQLNRENKNLEAIDTLYADNIESIEAADSPLGDRVTKGIAAVRKKNIDFAEHTMIHRHTAEGPYPHGTDRFAVHFTYDFTLKGSGQRIQRDEIGLFTVAGGKVVREEFFYDMS